MRWSPIISKVFRVCGTNGWGGTSMSVSADSIWGAADIIPPLAELQASQFKIQPFSMFSKTKETQLDTWQKYWVENNLFWHDDKVHPFLMKYMDRLTRGKDSLRVFVPLCGKTVDMKWLYDAGHTVVGVEAVEKGILEFFQEQQLKYKTENIDKLKRTVYKTEDERLQIIHCDMFHLTGEFVGKFDTVWDRGSLVIIDKEDMTRYVDIIRSLLHPDFHYLLAVVQYDSTTFDGPPKSVSLDTIKDLYGSFCNIEILQAVKIPSTESKFGIDVCNMMLLLTPKKDT